MYFVPTDAGGGDWLLAVARLLSARSQRQTNACHAELVEPDRHLFGRARLVIFQPPHNCTDPGVQDIVHSQVNGRAAGIGLRSLAGQHASESLFYIVAETLGAECWIALLAKHHPVKVSIRLHVPE